jgi:hypothetical protein
LACITQAHSAWNILWAWFWCDAELVGRNE